MSATTGSNANRLSLEEAQIILADEINSSGDALSQYTYLLGRASTLPRMTDDEKASCEKVPGCQAQVWIHVNFEGGACSVKADSDTAIVRGILALLSSLLSGRPAGEVACAEITFIADTEIRHALSPSRVSGLRHILRAIKARAREYLDERDSAEALEARSQLS